MDATAPTDSLTGKLTRLIRAKPVSQADLDAGALYVLDAVANSLAGRQSEPGRVLLAWWRGPNASNAAPNAPADTARSAFLMGALTHILETDDLHRDSVVHPGCVVVPAAWALAQAHGADSRRFLTAVLHGFEAAARIGMAVGPAHYRIWHNTATCGPFGAAMAAACLLDLDDGQTVHALGNAGSQSAGLWEFLDTGAMTKHLHAGHAAEAGLRAAELAAHGFTGPPRILEGDKGFFRAACPDADPEAVVRDGEAPWQLLRTSIKPWPSCRHTHPAIDAGEEARAALLQRGIDPAGPEVARVDVETYGAALDVCDRPDPRSDYEAKFSLQHAAAAALALDRVDFEAFGAEARQRCAPLTAKVQPRLAEPYAAAYPQAWGSAVTVHLAGGDTIRASRTHAKGDPEAPLSRDEMIDKARMLMDHARVPDPERLAESILALGNGGALPDLGLV